MKGIPIEEVLEHVQENDESKFIKHIQLIDLETDYRIELQNNIYIKKKELDVLYLISDHALDQLCRKLNIPVEYIRRCPKELAIFNLNFWLSQYKDISVCLIKNNILRAIYFTEYLMYTNISIINLLISLKQETGFNFEISEYCLDSNLFYIRLIFPDLFYKQFSLGLDILNSETGTKNFNIYPTLYYKQPKGVFIQSPFSIIEGESLENMFLSAFTSIIKNKEKYIEEFYSLRDIPVTKDKVATVLNTHKISFNKSMRSKYKFIDNMFKLRVALSYSCKSVQDFDIRFNLESCNFPEFNI